MDNVFSLVDGRLKITTPPEMKVEDGRFDNVFEIENLMTSPEGVVMALNQTVRLGLAMGALLTTAQLENEIKEGEHGE